MASPDSDSLNMPNMNISLDLYIYIFTQCTVRALFWCCRNLSPPKYHRKWNRTGPHLKKIETGLRLSLPFSEIMACPARARHGPHLYILHIPTIRTRRRLRPEASKRCSSADASPLRRAVDAATVRGSRRSDRKPQGLARELRQPRRRQAQTRRSGSGRKNHQPNQVGHTPGNLMAWTGKRWSVQSAWAAPKERRSARHRANLPSHQSRSRPTSVECILLLINACRK